MELILFVTMIAAVLANPTPERCFTGGTKLLESKSPQAMTYVCLKDDISYVKSEVVSTDEKDKNGRTLFLNTVFRKIQIDDWQNCRPEKQVGGPIMIISFDEHGSMESEDYVCKNDCEIKLDRDAGLINLETSTLNYYQISGTTKVSGWFKTRTSISLKHTCENIKIQCGEKSILLHACFKNHMECYQFLISHMLPKTFSSSVCANLEIIILTAFSIIAFLLLSILTKTYICYILLPFFIPCTYIYSKLYMKCCKICNNCGLRYHPFSPCGKICVCGSVYDSSERMKIHRQTGLCPGYKYMMSARFMCKSKGWNMIVAILLSVLFFSFITPIGANSTCYTLDEFPDMYINSIKNMEFIKAYLFYWLAVNSLLLLIFITVIITIHYFEHIYLRPYIFKCEDCKMFHSKHRLVIEEFGTSRCGSCTCGCPDDPPMVHFHQTSRQCVLKYIVKILKTYSICIILYCFISSTTIGAIATEVGVCDDDPIDTECWGLNIEKDIISNRNDINGTLRKMFPDMTEEELNIAHTDYATYPDFLIEARSYDALRPKQILEAVYFSRNSFHHITGADQRYYISWKLRTRVLELNTCKLVAKPYPCKCISIEEECTEFALKKFRSANLDNYLTDQTKLNWDRLKLQDAMYEFMPPTVVHKYISIVESKNKTMIDGFSHDIYQMYTNYPYILNFMYLLMNITSRSQDFSISALLQNQTHATTQILNRGLVTIESLELGYRKTCKNPKRYFCKSERVGLVATKPLLVCDRDTSNGETKRTLHRWSQDLVEVDQSIICRKDYTCSSYFDNSTDIELQTITKKKQRCNEIAKVYDPVYNQAISKCKMVEKGFCNFNGNPKQIVKCSDNTLVEQIATGNYLNDMKMDQVCFKTDCGDVKRIHPDSLTNCTINVPRQLPVHIDRVDTNDFKIYKAHLEEDFLTTLSKFYFMPTKGLPHIVPDFRPIYLRGTETTDGLESSYFEIEMIALSGKATGIKLYASNDLYLFDVVIYVQAANVTSTYVPIYRTGPTLTFNVKHEEICTGLCPSDLPRADNTWMTFSKESTSTWGCEEFGCLAIGEGCVYGQCKNVIKPESEVWEKQSEERITLNLCITTSYEYYCKEIESTVPLITNKIEAQFNTIESFKHPERILIRNHIAFQGQINGLREYNSYCGNVQIVGSTTMGMGIPKMDYKCHAASRKDVIVRHCYDNNYLSCLELKPLPKDMIEYETDKLLTLNTHNKITGTLKLKIKLGDIQYKLFQEDTKLDITGECVGCIDCIDGITCRLEIPTSTQSTCTIKSNCETFINRIVISPNDKNYHLKFQCRTKTDYVSLDICGNKKDISLKLSSVKPQLEVLPQAESAYVKERDDKCSTWLCKVKDQGIGFLFSPFTGFFGEVWHYVVLFLAVMITFFIVVYILIPCLFKCRDILRKQQAEFIVERKLR
ncbi:polyprotein [Orthobunyavirus tacaiumaense]|uniref:Envelopment polyprotein n=1 Tax=Orthobunyavirus tacaiumaense TaxID=3052444 RepID=A0A2I4SI68_9VIRU|nr:polyprotein [Orthobunyavirus tacaiumaense]ASY08209.1 polyprotein [Orthobunyavirus tacaiumaense]